MKLLSSVSTPISFFPWVWEPGRTFLCSNLSQIITNYSVWPKLLLDQPATPAVLVISTTGFTACLKPPKYSSLLLENAYPDMGLCQNVSLGNAQVELLRSTLSDPHLSPAGSLKPTSFQLLPLFVHLFQVSRHWWDAALIKQPWSCWSPENSNINCMWGTAHTQYEWVWLDKCSLENNSLHETVFHLCGLSLCVLADTAVERSEEDESELSWAYLLWAWILVVFAHRQCEYTNGQHILKSST